VSPNLLPYPQALALMDGTLGGGWLMCHGYADTLQAFQKQLRAPNRALPAIAAFTPYKNGQNGITIGEFTIQL
jgi:hypothetical protein